MKRSLDVGVIGAGTAGAAAALFLARAGHRVTVYERVADPRPAGAGILLQPTGRAVLRRFGLRDAVVARAAPVRQLRAETLARRELFRLRYADIPGAHVGYGRQRSRRSSGRAGSRRVMERSVISMGGDGCLAERTPLECLLWNEMSKHTSPDPNAMLF